MCIIVAKPANIEMPDTETLKNCFANNPDGSGFMYADGKTVRIRKGFMTFESFIKALDREIPENLRTETPIVMHFRIATHGKVQPSCCHPFPLTDEPSELRKTMTESRIGVAHNGVIQGRFTNDSWSDTMDFVSGIMTPLFRMNSNFMRNSNALELLEDACGSKLAILENSGELVTVGKFVEDDGVLYSNTSYLKTYNTWSSYTSSIWGDKNYLSAYGDKLDLDYGDDDEYAFGDMQLLINMLPHAACADCIMNEECALTHPYCETAAEAEDVAEYYEEVWEEENEKYIVKFSEA